MSESSSTSLQPWLVHRVAELLELPEDRIDPSAPLADLGLSSRHALELAGDLQDLVGRELDPTLLWELPTIAKLAAALELPGTEAGAASGPDDDQPIAVIGMACRFPGATGLDEFWQLLESGEYPDLLPRRGPLRDHADSHNLLDDLDQFDPVRFAISPVEAERMDPQQRLLLEVSWEAFEHAGVLPAQLAGRPVGVFVGLSTGDYQRLSAVEDEHRRYLGTGSALSVAANRLSYTYDLTGPSLAVDTACSSSLAAVHLACRSIAAGECESALAGGVNVILDSRTTDVLRSAGMISPTNACRTFDGAADGYLRAEGCGLVLLKRLDRALADGDRVLGLIKGSAMNQDGRSNGLSAPNAAAQRAVIHAAQRQAGVSGAEIGYVECHGTGTPLGDPIEVKALSAELGRPAGSSPCLVGSVKASIGHAEAAAGVAGLIKVLLQAGHGVITRHPRSGQENPLLELGPAVAVADRSAWSGRRLAGISSFGFGGTNVHLVVEGPAEAAERAPGEGEQHVFVLSARSEAGVRESAARMAACASTEPEADVASFAYTLTERRTRFGHGVAFVADAESVLPMLQSVADGEPAAGIHPFRPAAAAGAVVVFGGQVSSVEGLGIELLVQERRYREFMQHCAELLRPELEVPLLEVLYSGCRRDLASSTTYIQPAIVAHQLSLFELLGSWGVRPSAVVGHSLGELSAAAAAGSLDLEDLLRLAAVRGRAMECGRDRGRMYAVRESADRIAALLHGSPDDGYVVAALNGPQSTVLGVPVEHEARVLTALRAAGTSPVLVNESYAFHSPSMDAAVSAIDEAAGRIAFRPPVIPIASTSTGTMSPADGPGSVGDPSYWGRQARRPVRFGAAIGVLAERLPGHLFVELGATAQLGGAALTVRPDLSWIATAHSIRHPAAEVLDVAARLAAARLPVRDIESGDLMDLPVTPFDREVCWLSTTVQTAAGNAPPDPPAADPMPASVPGHAQPPSRQEAELPELEDAVIAEIARLLAIAPGRVDPSATFLDLGADSVMLIQLVQVLRERFGIDAPVSELFGRLNTVTRLAEHVRQNRRVEVQQSGPVTRQATPPPPPQPQPQPLETPVATRSGTTGVEAFLATHERVMAQAAQILGVAAERLPRVQDVAVIESVPDQTPQVAAVESSIPSRSGQLTDQQEAWIRSLVARFVTKTRASRRLAESGHRFHADIRQAPAAHELLRAARYPLVVESAAGAAMVDADGNRYVDITMGFGCHLFGNNPEFLRTAVRSAIDSGQTFGPQPMLAARIAEKFCTLVGHERMTFCNTGSEAVMLALRLARAVTGRPKVVIFEGSYHGISDSVLAGSAGTSRGESIPMVPGASPGVSDDVLVLPYGDPAALAVIVERADEIAGVLVEPVQSRRPGHQPQDFCRELRAVTERSGIALIFDEVIMGFRAAVAGMQTVWGIRPDLSVYGKVLGGGMPIGVVAGDGTYLNAVDGGPWHFSGGEYLRSARTFYTGTFCKHPLALAAAERIIDRFRADGARKLDELGRRTESLCDELNEFFRNTGVAVRIARCASLFRFEFPGESSASLPVEAFYLALADRGLYVWEGRNCFLSTAHDDADVRQIRQVVQDVVTEMAGEGFFGGRVAVGARRTEAVSDALPATRQQQELWYLHHLYPADARGLVERMSLDIDGHIDLPRLTAAITAVIRRHDSFRMWFPDGRTVRLANEIDVPITVVDLERVPAAVRDAAWSELVASDEHLPFDLKAAPLVRVTVGLRGTRTQLLLSAHHTVVDGWAIDTALREISELYVDPDARLPRPTAARAFAEWQADYLRSAAKERDVAFWLDRFPAGWQSPQLSSRPDADDSPGGRLVRHLTGDTVAEVGNRARMSEVTPFAVLLEAYGRALHRSGAGSTFTIGVPVATRTAAGLDRLVANCANIIPVGFDSGSAQDSESRLRDLAAGFRDALDHSALPMSELRDRWREAGETAAGSALLPYLFNVNRLTQPFRLAGLDVAIGTPPRTTSPWTLFLDVAISGDDWELVFDFDLTQLSRAAIDAFADEFVACLLDPGRAPSARQPAGTQGPSQRRTPSALERFCAQAVAAPQSPALMGDGVEVSYGDLLDRATSLAAGIRSRRKAAPALVGLALRKTDPDSIAMLLATWLAGAVPVLLDRDWPPSRLTELCGRVGAFLLVSDDPALAGIRTPAVVVSVDNLAAAVGTPGSEPVMSPADTAYICFTSGSTGTPKAVAVSQDNLASVLEAWDSAYGLAGFDRRLQLAGPAFDVYISDIVSTLCSGGAVVLFAKKDIASPRVLVETIQRFQVDYIEMVPVVARRLFGYLEQTGESLPSIKILCIGGGAITLRELERMRSRLGPDARLADSYGLTEVTIDSTYHLVEPGGQDELLDLAPIGRPLPGTRTLVVDDELRPVPTGRPGQLLIGGPGVAFGYLNDPRATAARFLPDPTGGRPGDRAYLTGDLVRVVQPEPTADGVLIIQGRSDSQIELRGLRIEPEEIEVALRNLNSVVDAAVTVAGDTDDEKRIVAVVVPDAAEPTLADIRSALSAVLPASFLPSELVVAEELPVNSTGKVDRRRLAALTATTAPAPEPGAPIGTTVRRVMDIWSKVLSNPGIGPDHQLFAIGGNSLHALEILSLVQAEFGVELSAAAMLADPTPRRTAALLATDLVAESGASAADAVEPARPQVAGSGGPARTVSSVQERFWILQQAEPQSSSYNLTFAFDVTEELSVPRLGSALDDLVADLPILRQTFVERDGTVFAAAGSAVAPRLPVIDLSGLPETDREATLSALIEAQDDSPFDLANGPMFALSAFHCGPRRWTLAFTCHHIVCDPSSLAILADRFVQALRPDADAAAERTPAPDYGLYVAQEERDRQSGLWDRDVAFWAQQLDDVTLGTTLTEKTNPQLEHSPARMMRRTLPQGTVDLVRATAADQGASMFMVLSGAVALALAELTSTKDVVIGTQLDGRVGTSMAGLVGPILHTVLLRFEIPGSGHLDRDFVRHCRTVCAEAFEHRHAPFQEVVRQLSPIRTKGRHPYFQVMTQYLPWDASSAVPESFRPRPTRSSRPKFELTLDIVETDREIEFQAVFDTIRLTDDQVADLLDRCVRKLERFCAGGSADQDLLHSAFDEWALRHGDDVAVRSPLGTWTYAEVGRTADRIGRVLVEKGVAAGSRVGVVMDRSDPWIVPALLAVLRCGAAYVPVDADMPRLRVDEILDTAGVVAVLTTRRHTGKGFQGPRAADLLVVDDAVSGADDGPGDKVAGALPSGSPCYVIFTSGSTGRPKGVVVPHASVVRRLAWQQTIYPLDAGAVVPLTFSPAFDASVWQIFGTLSRGGSVLVLDRKRATDPQAYVELIETHRCPVLKTVPAMLALLLRTEGIERLNGILRQIGCGGEELDGELYRACRERLPDVQLYNMYGPTETTINATFWSGDLPAAGQTPIGVEAADTTVLLLDEELNRVPAGESGQIFIGGAALALGYLEDPRSTAERFLPAVVAELAGARMYRSGDVGRRREDGLLLFGGRVDRQVQVRGHRVELEETERLAREVLGTGELMVLKVGDGLVIAVGDQRAGTAWPRAREELLRRLPEYAVPGRCSVLDRIPRLPSGKIDAAELRRLVVSGREVNDDPELGIATGIRAIWADLLGHDDLSDEADFFVSGGHSLLGVRLAMALTERYGVRVSLSDLFGAGSIAEQAALIERLLDQPAPSGEVATVQEFPKAVRKAVQPG